VVSVTRAWIRGVGVVSALGRDWPMTAAALARGACGIAEITRFDAHGMPCTVASVVPVETEPGDDRRITLARHATREAWRMAGLIGGDRVGVFVGAESGMSCFAAARALAHATDATAACVWADPRHTSATAVAWALARDLGARGPCRTVSLACASGTAALLEAVRSLRSGACDAAVCVGVGAHVDPLQVAAFGRLGALSTRGRSSPFDASRDGFVLGEGAAAMVLSIERGDARAELAGGARSFDGGSLTAPDPTAAAAQRAIRDAIACIAGTRIGYVAAHGTSTPSGDAAEATALRGVFGDDLGGARVGAVKGALGHWIAGAGSLAAVCAWHAVVHGELLPTIGVEQIGDDCVLPHVLGRAQHQPVGAAIASSFGFGGANACVVVRGPS
jgi:3-oxoacyl-[acyl-carrier-protein] synthase II